MTPETATYDPGVGVGPLAILFLILGLGWCCWFFGRCYEANVTDRYEAEEEAAYRWAAAHNKLPPPVIKTVYVDTETGEELHGYEG